jgi:hypothetical protein
MPHVVTSAAGVDGNGHGALLRVDFNGRSCGAFSEDSHIADPRGLAAHRDEACSSSIAAATECCARSGWEGRAGHRPD